MSRTTWPMSIGSAVIVLAGLFIFHRQKVVAAVPPENVPKGVS